MQSRFFPSQATAFVRRHRHRARDAALVAIALAFAGLYAFEVDLFEGGAPLSEAQKRVEVDELLALTALTMVGVLFYSWRRAAEYKREVASRVAAEKEALTLAFRDPLTGLWNRRRFDDALRSALRVVPAAPEAHAVFMLDLNGFKKINDLHGHPVGDEVLIHVGSRLLRAVRDGDLVARLGGDEFAILARNVSGAEGAAYIGQRIVDSFAEPVTAGGAAHPVGAAVGVALSPQDGQEREDLLRKADVALYRAKAERKATMRFFEREMDARLRERDALERALRTAVERDAFVLRFQPAGFVGQDRIASFEASPRWPHPAFGELEADRFAPIAEEAGLLAELTAQLLRKACRAASTWPAPVRLAFNLPGGLLADTSFAARILAILAETPFPANRFDLEIDEGALIRDTEAAEALMTPLRSAGVSIVADHFGTGYSDLKNLNRLKLDRVKIDPGFIAAMTHDRQAAVMVRALIGVGQGLDLDVIADGVTTEDQMAALAGEGCGQAQGAFYGGAVTAEEALALVRSAAPDAPPPGLANRI